MVSSTSSTASSGTLFAIGDLQGCLESLEELLAQLPQDAELLFVGDLVNRGPQSLQTLRFVKNLGSRARSILGNHDLHLLAVAAGAGEMHKKDTIADILSAPDRDELINWLRNQPLLIEQGGVLFAHAGIHPLWDLPTAQKLAQEAHEALAGPQWQRWLQGMYGNTQWSPDLTGEKRMRAILNGFTRMRFVNALTGELDFRLKRRGQAQLPRVGSLGLNTSIDCSATTPYASGTGQCWASSTAPTWLPSIPAVSGAASLPPFASRIAASFRKNAPAGPTRSLFQKNIKKTEAKSKSSKEPEACRILRAYVEFLSFKRLLSASTQLQKLFLFRFWQVLHEVPQPWRLWHPWPAKAASAMAREVSAHRVAGRRLLL